MNRKQFLWLMLLVMVMGGAGLGVFWKDITAYRDSGAKIGAQLLNDMRVSDVAKVRVQDAHNETTLVLKDKVWRVEQRGGYPADFGQISALILKLLDVKALQSETVGASLHGRLNLLAPGKGGGKDKSEGTGTQLELFDAAGKRLAGIMLGKVSLKKDPLNPLPNARDGVPAGRHVLVAGREDRVVVVGDPLERAVAAPGAWVARDFFKAERIRALRRSGADGWQIGRDEEWGQWRFLSGGGQLNPSAAVAANNALGNPEFTDVVVDDKVDFAKAIELTADTFDGLTYRVQALPQPAGDYLVKFSVSGKPPATRKREAKEKAEETEKLDKEFADTMKRLEARVMVEQARSQWTYRVAGKTLEPLLRPRDMLLAGGR
jgi:hypothetical protein